MSHQEFRVGDLVAFPGYNGEWITGEIISFEGSAARVECGDREPWTVPLADLSQRGLASALRESLRPGLPNPAAKRSGMAEPADTPAEERRNENRY